MSLSTIIRKSAVGLAAALLLTATASRAGQDRELHLRAYDLGGTVAGPDALPAAMKEARILGDRTVTGTDADIAHSELVTGTGRYDVELVPGADADHRVLMLRYLSEGRDAEGHPTRNRVALKPRDIVPGKTYLLSVPPDSRYVIEVCTGAPGDCPDTAKTLGAR